MGGVSQTHPQTRTTTKLVTLLSTAVVVAVVLAAVVSVRAAAEREYAAYDALRSLGATGDDWVSFGEFITSRPPIVQIEIPANLPTETAFHLLPELSNLEAVTIAYDSLTDDQLNAIGNLRLESIRFTGAFPSDDDVRRLSHLRGTRFIYIPSSNLSERGHKQVQDLLPSSNVTFD